ncbi:phosphonate C-P lyase system protein PhnH [Marinobacter confluentis]|uniref:Phosphonate C-P lyase system protein PhnH n=1 Tax=Marinobacter confluentis TaxID=1697557 RepID=A0A4Z1C0S8_9GAMM|nr:phosphonate C-P lyase system protein PhnH [Marinobacter confluentis]TGN39503.1 phosphonate C-P lyase system protein PhnH [Marinobacter confluentis]
MPDSSTLERSRPMHSGSDLLRFWQPVMQQALFRSLLTAFSYPGQSVWLADADSAVAILATLVDAETTLSDPYQLLSDLTRTRLNAPLTDPERAGYVIARGDLDPGFSPRLGTLESPEAGATVVVIVDSLVDGEGEGQCWRLSGPGIEQSRKISVGGLDASWLSARNEWCSGFPLGVDLILTDQHRCLALPRTTVIDDTGAN